jgi:hypothetical protein
MEVGREGSKRLDLQEWHVEPDECQEVLVLWIE